jgi:hypothetical protein
MFATRPSAITYEHETRLSRDSASIHEWIAERTHLDGAVGARFGLLPELR